MTPGESGLAVRVCNEKREGQSSAPAFYVQENKDKKHQ